MRTEKDIKELYKKTKDLYEFLENIQNTKNTKENINFLLNIKQQLDLLEWVLNK